MLDSSNKVICNDTFDAERFFIDECRSTKIINERYPEIRFPKGWSEIVKTLISSINMHRVKILEVSDFYSVLDIRYELMTIRSELRLRRAFENAREMSTITCGACGNSKDQYSTLISTPTKYCDNCLRNAAHDKKTGTWLDKF